MNNFILHQSGLMRNHNSTTIQFLYSLSDSLDEPAVGLHGHGGEGAVRHRVVEGVAGGCVTPDGVVARPHALQVQVHRHELELGLVLLHREAQGVTWKDI